MGHLIKWIGSPVADLLDRIVAFKISWVPVGMLAVLAAAVLSIFGFLFVVERIPDDDESKKDNVIFRMICFALNCALMALLFSEYVPVSTDGSMMLCSLSEGLSSRNFSEWGFVNKLFFWCAVINAGSAIISEVILCKNRILLPTLLFMWLCGVTLGHSLIPLSAALSDITVLFMIVLPVVHGLLIGLMYLSAPVGVIFCVIKLGDADMIAGSVMRNLPKNNDKTETAEDLFDEAVRELRRAQMEEERRQEEEHRASKVDVYRHNGLFLEHYKVSSDGKRYYDEEDGEWHRVDDLKK